MAKRRGPAAGEQVDYDGKDANYDTPCQGHIFATMDNENELSKAAHLLQG